MSEPESLALVGAAGIAVTEVVAVTDAAAAVREARTIGRPVALKLDAVGLAHKSDVGGVALGLRGDDAVYGAALDPVRDRPRDAGWRSAGCWSRRWRRRVSS